MVITEPVVINNKGSVPMWNWKGERTLSLCLFFYSQKFFQPSQFSPLGEFHCWMQSYVMSLGSVQSWNLCHFLFQNKKRVIEDFLYEISKVFP